MNNFIKNLQLAVVLLAIIVAISSCKKDDPVDQEAIKEKAWALEVHDVMSQLYLWNNILPTTLDNNKYNTAQKALDYLSSIKINSATMEPIDKYSFLDKIGNLSGEIGEGTASGDFGFMVTAALNASNTVSFYVNYVYKNSPAGKAGVERTFEITKINGSTSVHPGVTSSGYLDTSSAGYINMVNALFYSSNSTFSMKKPNGTTIDVALTAASYQINSVLMDSIYTVNNKKAGYIVFNEFLGEPSQIELAKTINRFEANGVTDLIIDLRYNGGGSVATCEYFCNLIAPASAHGNVMYRYNFNSLLTQYAIQEKWETSFNFNKTNSFSPNSICFIVSDNTASASELLINNLLPYMQGKIQLIGSTTYGKPCGFWGEPIGYDEDQTTTKEGYDLYAVSFETRNALNEGGYYQGMEPGTSTYPGKIANDYVSIPWGNISDDCLANALSYIGTGAFKTNAMKAKGMSGSSITSKLNQFKFNGMIDFSHKF